ncbi:MAG: hypothetical protein CL678_01430 [Bdellovibrionaceae bacterium]|nr:hypothetical protein [Pseudobdellovibrionaceae bacterium]|tara:strand:+ start:263 stop:1390 length:1128 start_codon:yes stop_codon:yes gene_type:complete
MKSIKISKQIAKKLVLQSQLLDQDQQRSTLAVIKKLGYIQIDSISVIERSHHHVLWSRNKSYVREELNDLMQKKKIFEYWTHAASYLPIEDYPYCLPRMNQYKDGKKHWFSSDKKMLKYVVDRIKKEGPLSSKDFKDKSKSSGWYDWKPAKKALEQLFMDGTLMTKERRSFHKVYDLAENVLPSDLSIKTPTDREFANYLIKKQLQSLGIASVSEIAYMRGAEVKNNVKQEVVKLVEEGKVLSIFIPEIETEYFCLKNYFENFNENSQNSNLNILSPFDNLIIQRKRLNELFDFDYQLECYLPVDKRKFGYFNLPILYKDQFVGTIDLKAHRKLKELEVLSLHMIKKNKQISKILTKKLNELSAFNQCETVIGRV